MGDPMLVGTGHTARPYCDGHSLASPGRWPLATLVADGALPAGHLQGFLRLVPWISSSAQRQATPLAGTDDLTAALFLHEEEQKRRTRIIEEKASAEQLLAAAGHHQRSTNLDCTSLVFKDPPLVRTLRSLRDNVGSSSQLISSSEQTRRWENCYRRDKAILRCWVQVQVVVLVPPGAGSGMSVISSPGLRLTTGLLIPRS